jgi:protein-tyrosine phosphatase
VTESEPRVDRPSPERDAGPSGGSWRRSPLMLALRGLARSAIWRVRELHVRNPPLPPRVRSILFVCKGNICRSPFAAFHAEALCRELGVAGVRNTSAGIRPSQANACPADALATAARRGYDMRSWRPVLLTTELMDAFDLVVVMEVAQLQTLRARWPQHASRIVLLSLFGEAADRRGLDAWSRLNIADPFGRGPEAFERCYARLDLALRALCAQLHAAARPDERVAGGEARPPT